MVLRASILLAVFLAASAVIARAERTEQVPPRKPLTSLPMMLGEWSGRQDPPMTPEELKILGADDYTIRTYFTPQRRVAGLYIGFWETQKRGDTVHSPLNCLPGSGWQPLSHGYQTIAVRDANDVPREIEVNRYVIQKGLDRLMVFYWYHSHDRVIASEYAGKFYLVADAIRMSRSDTGIVRVTTPINDATASGEADAERTSVEFVQQIFPILRDYIPS
jgi:EpsI family protein